MHTAKIDSMSTATSFSLPDYGFTPQLTLAELAHRIGDVPIERICFDPLPGTATQADLLRLNEGEGKCFELIHGTLVHKAMGSLEGFLAGWLATKFNNYLDNIEIGAAFGDNVALVFSPKLVYIPDAGFIASARLPGGRFPDSPLAELVPNLAVEIISVSNTKKEMERKLTSYFECGVEEVWYVYPQQLQVLQFLPSQEPKILAIDDTITTQLLPGFSLAVKTLFSPPGRRLK